MASALTSAALKTTAASTVGDEPQPVSSQTTGTSDPAVPAPTASTTSRELKGVSQALLDRVGAM